jgi:hypothetical protein
MALQLQTAADGVVRDAHYIIPTGASEAVRTLLTEPQGTNLFLWSQDATQTAWTKVDTTPTANASVAPTGSATADLLVEGSAGTAAFHQTVTVASGATVAASRWLKRDNHDWVLMEVANDASPGTDFLRLWVNLATGALGSTTVGGTGVASAFGITSQSWGNGWYRVALVGSIGSATAYRVTTHSASADASTTRVNGARRLEFGRQVGTSSVMTTYVPTVGTSASREPDSLYWEIPSLVPQELTVYYRGVQVGALDSSLPRLWHIGQGSTAVPRLWLETRNTGIYRINFDNGTDSRLAGAASGIALNDVFELRCVLGADGSVLIGQSINAGTETVAGPSAGATLPGAFNQPRFWLGRSASGAIYRTATTHIGIFRGTRDLAYCRANTGVV